MNDEYANFLEYEADLQRYAQGFDSHHISELCRVLSPEQIRLFQYFLDAAELQIIH